MSNAFRWGHISSCPAVLSPHTDFVSCETVTAQRNPALLDSVRALSNLWLSGGSITLLVKWFTYWLTNVFEPLLNARHYWRPWERGCNNTDKDAAPTKQEKDSGSMLCSHVVRGDGWQFLTPGSGKGIARIQTREYWRESVPG